MSRAGEFARSLSMEDRISVAEQAMERGGLAGRKWHLNYRMNLEVNHRGEGPHKPVHDFVHGVLAEHGVEARPRIIPREWEARQAGAQAMTDGYNKIGIAGEHTNDMTLLHEAAHVIDRSHEGGGHTEEFARKLHGLYAQHLGPDAAHTFSRIVGLTQPSS